jgi:DTW domain-containing protein
MLQGRPGHRCAVCRLISDDCLCALIPRIETRTRIVLVLHEFEDRKPSNTGRLAQRCLPNSEVVIRGGFERSTDVPVWDQHGDPVLLFPHPDARPVEAWRDHGRPITLVVPDGTWRQAQRVRRRIAGLAEVPCALVSRAAPSNYLLRRTPFPGRLATMEAIAEALGILEGVNVRDALLRIFQVMVERSMRVRAPVAREKSPRLPTLFRTGGGHDIGPALDAGHKAATTEGSGDVDLGIEDAGQDRGAIRR